MDNDPPLTPPILLRNNHSIIDFDCGHSALNMYLTKYALQNIYNSSARTYVTTRIDKVIGYYTLAYSSVSSQTAPTRVSKGLGQYPIPVILLARLAVDSSEKGKGIGKGLLKDALLRTIQASEIAGLRAVLVHAKDDTAKEFYKIFGFEKSPIDEFHLYLLMKDIKKNFLQ
jgi:GNAT superfamily N-acetyltransferase